uniref:Prefoldin subunit 5 n=1 Tax=Chlorocebus sabaeus TaxID=60711 RepID=A0A0D9QZM3_CHLSB
MAQSINITELNLPQLEMLKNQLDQEVEFLSTSIAQLKVVQTKYVEAKDCLNVLNKSNEGKELLVPLTSSMYVPGKLHDVEHVLIDVGTGYYVEKTAEDAKDFFKRKIDFLTKQMEKIQPALQEKHAMKQGKFFLGHLLTLSISMIKNMDCRANHGGVPFAGVKLRLSFSLESLESVYCIITICRFLG